MNGKDSDNDERISILKPSGVTKNQIKIVDQEYGLYKAGINFYGKIHPSAFYKPGTISNLFSGFDELDYDDKLIRLQEVFDFFYMAEFYFKKLLEEYPDSIWNYDAKEKLAYLKMLKEKYLKFDF